MVLGERGLFVLWLGLATMLAISASPIMRNRRIVNEPGDVPRKGIMSLPFHKRQQIIYLLNNNTSNKRDKQPDKSLEKYAKELTLDGKVVRPHATKFLSSEDFHGGGVQEIAVNKGDGPPVFPKSVQKSEVKSVQRTHDTGSFTNSQDVTKDVKSSGVLYSSTANRHQNQSSTSTLENNKRTQTPLSSVNTTQTNNKNAEDPSTLRVKNSYIRPVERLSDGEIMLPAKPIDPGVFDISQSDIQDRVSRRDYNRRQGFMRSYHGEEGSLFLPEDDQPVRRWRDPRRWRHHHYYYRRRHRPVIFDHRPNVYYMPMYSRPPSPSLIPFAAGQQIPSAPQVGTAEGQNFQPAAYGNPVMMQSFVPLVDPQQGLPVVSSQPVMQSPFTQQPDARSAAMYTVPVATSTPQAPQPIVYPVMALPAVQQPQQLVQLQPLAQQQESERDSGQRHLASHWVDEQGHSRSEVDEEEPPKPRDYDDDRRYDRIHDDDKYRPQYEESRYDNERRYHNGRDDEQEHFLRDNWEDYQRNDEDQYRGSPYQEENPYIRSEQPTAPPSQLTEDNKDDDDDDDDDDDENESDAYQHELQDSKDETPSADSDSPPEIERDEPPPPDNYHSPNMESPNAPSVIRIPPFPSRLRMHSQFAAPNSMSVDTFTREQLIGPPLRENALPRLINPSLRTTPIESPQGQISEMSAEDARFRERMRMELQAKDTIPRGAHKNGADGLKNVIIRLNGEPLENASELRSRIVHGRIIPGKGKIIRSKGPMKIRVSHRGVGKNRIKIIDIFSPKKYSVVDSRSKISRVAVKKQNPKRSQIERKPHKATYSVVDSRSKISRITVKKQNPKRSQIQRKPHKATYTIVDLQNPKRSQIQRKPHKATYIVDSRSKMSRIVVKKQSPKRSLIQRKSHNATYTIVDPRSKISRIVVKKQSPKRSQIEMKPHKATYTIVDPRSKISRITVKKQSPKRSQMQRKPHKATKFGIRAPKPHSQRNRASRKSNRWNHIRAVKAKNGIRDSIFQSNIQLKLKQGHIQKSS